MKKSFLTFVVMILALTSVVAQGSIEVTVKNIKEAKGSIRVGLFDKEENFLEKPIEGKVVKASNGDVTVVFEGLAPGNYAISIIHDENDNGELDSNMMGIPKEGFAFGNNAMGMFGPPDFDKAKISVNGQKVKQEITLKYM